MKTQNFLLIFKSKKAKYKEKNTKFFSNIGTVYQQIKKIYSKQPTNQLHL